VIFYSVTKKNEILSFTGKWMELKNVVLNEVRFGCPNAAYFLSNVEYRPDTNTVKL
jgi:hypothetical protein